MTTKPLAEDPAPQLLLLRDLTARTGQVFKAQVDLVRVWGRFILKTKPETRIDLIEHHVEYVLVEDVQVAPNLIQGLARSIKWLLGDDWTTKITTPKVRRQKGPTPEPKP